MIINIFIQARMSSSRFPGKVLAPLRNKPLIKHIVDRARQTKGIHKVVVLTSADESDDPLAAYLEKIACDFFRGDLSNVFNRFREALGCFPCDNFVRLSADSPLLDSNLITSMIQKLEDQPYDVVSNVIDRTFPKGQSVEIIKSSAFMEVDNTQLTAEEREHVFPYFYRHKDKYRHLSVESQINNSNLNLCIDTLEDLERLSRFERSY